MTPPPRILVFAYACEPHKGSEPTAGWIWSRMLAHLGETYVVTRANNREAIEKALPALSERDRLTFVYVDLPRWARRWKRGQRGVRAYYLLWQAAALLEARRLHSARPFDLVWHVTLANAWLGSLAPLLGPRFVLGPVGGGVGMPWHLAAVLGARGAVYELARAGARMGGRYLNPLSRLAWRRAALILVLNAETRAWLPRRYRHKTAVFPNAVLDERLGDPIRRADNRTALFAGRLLPWKGAALAIEAITRAPDWRLRICGSGPDAARLRRLAARADVSARVAFDGWLPRDELLRVMREEADVLLFPSLHDDAPWAVVEALASGLRVICLDRGGPPLLSGPAGIAVSAAGRRGTVADALASALRAAAFPSQEASRRQAREYAFAARLEQLRAELESSGLVGCAENRIPKGKQHRLAGADWQGRSRLR